MRESTASDRTEDAEPALEQSSATPQRRTNNTVPQRRGSKYADILLQRLQTSVLHEHESAVIGIAAAGPRQGATTMAANLGIRAADHGIRPALLVDCNSNQRLSRLYRCSGPGLDDCLSGVAPLERCVSKTRYRDLKVLGLGRGQRNKPVVVDPDNAESLFKVIRNDYQFSVLDLPVPDEPGLAESLFPLLDGVLLVARYGIRRDQLMQLQRAVERSGGRNLGVVMTGEEKKMPGWLPRIFR